MRRISSKIYEILVFNWVVYMTNIGNTFQTVPFGDSIQFYV